METPIKLSTDLVVGQIDKALSSQDSTSFSFLQTQLAKLKQQVRETLQSLTRERMAAVVSKLEKKELIGAAELDLIRLWIVGDAESYGKAENNFKDWLHEVERLRDQIKHVSETSEVDPLRNLLAALSDLDRTTYGILNYLSERERIKKFEAATRIIDGSESRVLADMLKAKLNSPNM